jgi:thioredoxin reductase (NADPH)
MQRTTIINLSDGKQIQTHALIIATGARPRKLGIASETTYWAKGVTSCATCDGYFFRGKEVCVIGGGDSAMEEATFLTRFCTKVYLIHRRDTFRSSKIMTDRALANPKIQVIYDTTIDEILGDGQSVTGVRLHNLKTNVKSDLPLSGVFLAIGHIPNSESFKGESRRQ